VSYSDDHCKAHEVPIGTCPCKLCVRSREMARHFRRAMDRMLINTLTDATRAHGRKLIRDALEKPPIGDE
jgi:hypothetical protein